MNSKSSWVTIGIAAAATALTYGLSSPIAGVGILGNMLVGAGLGAAMGGLALLAQNKTPKTKRDIQDVNFTTSIRNSPVPVLFGRARVSGNYLLQGNFFRAKTKRTDAGGRVYVTHAIIGLCEGPLKKFGNQRIDGISTRTLADETYHTAEGNVSVELLLDPIKVASGTASEDVPDVLSLTAGGADKRYYKEMTRPVPWRNTAKLDVRAIAGVVPRLIDVSGDTIGPDYTVRLIGNTGGGINPNDSIYNTSGTAFYDSYSQCIYYTIASSGNWGTPYGLARIGRNGDNAYAHTSPPQSVVGSVGKAWYVGKHDVLVMQDPSDDSVFWVGYWGIADDSDDWEMVSPHPGYGTPILAMHLDELHSSLHTLHDDGTDTYILRWNLLTGRVEKTVIDDLGGTPTTMCYSTDFHTWIITDDSGTLTMISADTGGILHTNSSINLTSIRAVCSAGSRVGIVKQSSFLYYDFSDSTVYGPYGSSETNIETEGALGDIKASCQNTRTGQILVGRENAISNNCEWNLFIPSIVEDLEDLSANGSPKEFEFQWPLDEADCSPILNLNAQEDWVRDWSWRRYSGYSQICLEGSSSLAAALYASLVSYRSLDPTITDLDGIPLDTARWGAGIDGSLVDLPSFEALHAQCVGPVKYKNQLRTFSCDPDADTSDSSSLSGSVTGVDEQVFVERWAEKFKFDYLLDSETSWMDFAVMTALPACNGYLHFEDGKLHVGFTRAGAFPVWHFTNDQIDDGMPVQISFTDRLGGTNRIRVQFIEVRDEYRINLPAEWNDEWNQNAIGRVRSQTLTIAGCGRHGQAELLAKLVGDQAAATRQALTFGTHYLGHILSSGDVIEVSDTGTSLTRKRFKIISITDNEDDSIQLECREWNPLTEILKDNPVASPPSPGPEKLCAGCGDPFEWITGELSEHALGGSSVFIRSSEAFEVCVATGTSVQFEATSDDFVILTAEGDRPIQDYSGTPGDPVTLAIRGEYLIFKPTTGSLRATATCEKFISDEFDHAATIPAGNGGDHDQVSDFAADDFYLQDWNSPVTYAQLQAKGWLDTERKAKLQFHHIVCGNGFASITGFQCVAPESMPQFIAWDSGEVQVSLCPSEDCSCDARWFTDDVASSPYSVDPDLLNAGYYDDDTSGTDLHSVRASIVPDATVTIPATAGPDWDVPSGGAKWISARCDGQFYGLGDEHGTTWFSSWFYIGSYYGPDDTALDNWTFGFAAEADNGISEIWINGVSISLGDVLCSGNDFSFPAPASPGNYGFFRKSRCSSLQIGWNYIRLKVTSTEYARGMYIAWLPPYFGDYCDLLAP